MKYVVGVSDMVVSAQPGDEIVTHALGSCVGVVIHDPVAGVGGILHYMLPLSGADPAKSRANPCMFGDTGIPRLFEKAYEFGARKERLRVVIAGGAQVFARQNFFDIGRRNVVIARKLFWKNNVLIAAEHVGGEMPRTLYLSVGSGETWFTSHGTRVEL